MATLISGASGNFTTAATWRLVSATGFLDSEGSTVANSTSYVYSAAFAPGAISVDAIAVKVSSRSASSDGTITIALQNQTDSVYVEEITFAVSAVSANFTGWLLLPFSTTYTLLAGKNYRVGFKGSVSTRLTLYRDATSNNVSRMLRTTTTQAPAAGDQLHVSGLFGGAACVVTVDSTATTTYGTTALPQGITVNQGGRLTWETLASTTYYLKWQGFLQVNTGGVMEVGTPAAPIPASSTVVLHLDGTSTAANAGIRVMAGGTLTMCGPQKPAFTRVRSSLGGWCRTAATVVTALEGSQSFLGLTGTIKIGSNNYTIASVQSGTQLTLTGSAGTVAARWVHAASTGTLDVDSTEGWAAQDLLCLASTKYGSYETGTIATVLDSNRLALTSTLSNPYVNIEHWRSPVGNLTRNIVVLGNNYTTRTGFVGVLSGAGHINLVGVAFVGLGTDTDGRRGVQITTPSGTLLVDNCTFRQFALGNAGAVNLTAVGAAAVRNCVMYDIAGLSSAGIVQATTTAGSHSYENNLIVAARYGIYYRTTAPTTLCNGNVVCSADYGIYSYRPAGGFQLYRYEAQGITSSGLSASFNGNLPYTWDLREISIFAANYGINLTSNYLGPHLRIAQGTFVAVDRAIQYELSGGGTCVADDLLVYSSPYFAGDFSYTSVLDGGQASEVWLNNGTFWRPETSAYAQRPSRAVLNLTTFGPSVTHVNNCRLSPLLILNANTSTVGLRDSPLAVVTAQNLNQVPGWNAYYTQKGTVATDLVVANSVRLTSEPGAVLRGATMPVAVEAGKSLTVTVKTRESVAADGQAYDGDRPALCVTRHPALGLDADKVLATATAAGSGAFETLSGVVGPAGVDAVFSVYVRAGGTAYTQGWVNVQSASFSEATRSTGYAYWDAGAPLAANAFIATSSGALGGAHPYAS